MSLYNLDPFTCPQSVVSCFITLSNVGFLKLAAQFVFLHIHSQNRGLLFKGLPLLLLGFSAIVEQKRILIQHVIGHNYMRLSCSLEKRVSS
jgi:hypothetical protein